MKDDVEKRFWKSDSLITYFRELLPEDFEQSVWDIIWGTHIDVLP